MLTVKVNIDRGVARMGKLPDDIRESLKAEARAIAAKLKAVAKGKASGDVIGVRTGKYLKSIRTSVRSNQKGVKGKLYAKSPLANIFVNGAQIPAHLIAAKNVKALHFIAKGGGELYASSVQVPGAKLAPRDVIISTGRENRTEIQQGLHDALIDGLRKNAADAVEA